MTEETDKILIEIRELLRSREEKYDLYLKQSQLQYQKQIEESKNHQWLYLIWLCFIVTIGVFFGGLMLRASGG